MLINQGSNRSQLSNDKIIEAKGPIENSINIRNVLKIKEICLYFFYFYSDETKRNAKKQVVVETISDLKVPQTLYEQNNVADITKFNRKRKFQNVFDIISKNKIQK